MPLLVTTTDPLLTSSNQPISQVYAIIEEVNYKRKGLTPKRITASISYYFNELASKTAIPLDMPGLPFSIYQDASPEQANGLPIFDFLESLLTVRLQEVLPAGTLIERVA